MLLPTPVNRPCLATREAQADACLQAAATYRARLIAQAQRHGISSKEQAEELFQEAVLRAHDRIQTRGFTGEGEAFLRYLGRIMKLVYREQQRARYQLVSDERALDLLEAPALNPEAKAHGLEALSKQVGQTLAMLFPASDVQVFHLHVHGKSDRDIAALTGRNRVTLRRRITEMKQVLAMRFRWHWENLT